jgi:hypothetical protein
MKSILNTIFCGIIAAAFTGAAIAETYAVVVNAKNSFSGSGKDFFLLKTGSDKWPGGGGVAAFDLDPGADLSLTIVRAQFYKQFLGMTGSEYNSYWIQEKSKGRTKKPVSVASFKQMAKNVSREAGGIGFVPESLATGLKVLTKFEVK